MLSSIPYSRCDLGKSQYLLSLCFLICTIGMRKKGCLACLASYMARSNGRGVTRPGCRRTEVAPGLLSTLVALHLAAGCLPPGVWFFVGQHQPPWDLVRVADSPTHPRPAEPESAFYQEPQEICALIKVQKALLQWTWLHLFRVHFHSLGKVILFSLGGFWFPQI